MVDYMVFDKPNSGDAKPSKNMIFIIVGIIIIVCIILLCIYCKNKKEKVPPSKPEEPPAPPKDPPTPPKDPPTPPEKPPPEDPNPPPTNPPTTTTSSTTSNGRFTSQSNATTLSSSRGDDIINHDDRNMSTTSSYSRPISSYRQQSVFNKSVNDVNSAYQKQALNRNYFPTEEVVGARHPTEGGNKIVTSAIVHQVSNHDGNHLQSTNQNNGAKNKNKKVPDNTEFVPVYTPYERYPVIEKNQQTRNLTRQKLLPLPNSKEEAVSLKRAIYSIPTVEKLPHRMRNVIGHSDTSFSAYTNWQTDLTMFQLLANDIRKTLQCLITVEFEKHPNENIRNAPVYMDRYIDAIHTLFMSLKVKNPIEKVPFGDNWYVFSIIFTATLAYYCMFKYLLNQIDNRCKIATHYILAFLPTPTKTINIKRETYPIQMLAPYLVAHVIENDIDAISNTSEVMIARKNASMEIVKNRTRTGLHMDDSYLSYSLILSYNVLENLNDPMTSYYFALDRNTESPDIALERIHRSMLHPTIGYGNIGLFTQQRLLSCKTHRLGQIGNHVKPFSGILIANCLKTQFSMRVQMPHLAYYQVTKKLSDMAQFWVQYRRVHKNEETNLEPIYPQPGFIQVGNNNFPIDLRLNQNESTNMKLLKPKQCLGAVLAYKHLAFASNDYEITEFGDYTVKELVVVNSILNNITIYIKIENKNKSETCYYYARMNNSIEKFSIPPQKARTFAVILDQSTMRNTIQDSSTVVGFPFILQNIELRRHDENNESGLVLFDNKIPMIYAPMIWENEQDRLIKTIEQSRISFVFDYAINQYRNETQNISLYSQI